MKTEPQSAPIQYADEFTRSRKTPREFALYMWTRQRGLCVRVLEEIGSFPSSEPEFRALQEIAFRF